MIQYSLFANAKNRPLTKTYTINENGEIEKIAACEMTAGTVITKTSQLIDFIREIDGLKSSEGIGFGIPANGLAFNKITTASKQNGEVISRTKANFTYPEGNSLLHIDYDYDADSGQRYVNNIELHEILAGIIPAMANCPRVVVRSNSARVFKKGCQPTNAGGYHIYYVVERGSDIPKIAEYLKMALALNGHCYIKISKSGVALIRYVIDMSVFSPERHIFIGSPIVGVGLDITPKIVSAHPVGDPLKLESLVDYNQVIADGQKAIAALKETTKTDAIVILCDNQKSRLISSQNKARESFSSCKTMPVTLETIELDRYWILNTRELGLITLHDALRAGYEQLNCSDIYDLSSNQTRTVLYVNKKKSAFIHTFDDGGMIIDVSQYLADDKKEKKKQIVTIDQTSLPEITSKWGHSKMSIGDSVLKQTTGLTFEDVRLQLGIQYSYDNEGSPKMLLRQYSNYILQHMLYCITMGNDAVLTYSEGDYYVYNGKFHQRIEKNEALAMINSHFASHGVDPYYITAFHDKNANGLHHTLCDMPQYSRDNVTINLDNGTMVIRNGAFEIIPHSPATRHKSVENYIYDEHAEAPLFYKVLNESLPDDALRKTYQMAIGGILAGDNCKHFLLCEGGGANGKSTLIDAIGEVLGDDNTMHVTISNLLDEKGYYLPSIKSKRLCIIEEAEQKITNKGLLKSLINKDITMCRPIAQKPELLRDYSSFVANSNKIGGMDIDKSEAWARRIIVIPFLHQIPVEKRDVTLPKRMMKNEKPGILNWILEGYRMFVANGYKVETNEISQKALDETLDNACSVSDFLREGCVHIRPDGGMNRVGKVKLFDEYVRFCQSVLHQQHKGRITFGVAMKNYGFKIHKSETIEYWYKDIVF